MRASVKVNVIDRSAYSNAGFLHRIPVAAKLVGIGAALAIVVSSWDPWVLGALAVSVLALAWAGRLPILALVTIAAYSLVFSGLIAVTTAPTLSVALAIILKAYAATLAIVTVALSTPYPHLFGVLGRYLPGILNDALLMSYRSLFILAGVFSNLLRTLHLRGNISWRRPASAVSNIGTAAGNLVLSALDLAQADYEILRLRGYSDRIVVSTAPVRPDAPEGIAHG